MENITYELWVCYNTHLVRRLQDWQHHYDMLSREDARIMAKNYGFNMKRFNKLADHSNKKFNVLYKKDAGFVKVFHPTPVEAWNSFDKRQPCNIKVAEQIKEIKEENNEKNN